MQEGLAHIEGARVQQVKVGATADASVDVRVHDVGMHCRAASVGRPKAQEMARTWVKRLQLALALGLEVREFLLRQALELIGISVAQKARRALTVRDWVERRSSRREGESCGRQKSQSLSRVELGGGSRRTVSLALARVTRDACVTTPADKSKGAASSAGCLGLLPSIFDAFAERLARRLYVVDAGAEALGIRRRGLGPAALVRRRAEVLGQREGDDLKGVVAVCASRPSARGSISAKTRERAHPRRQ